MRSHRWILLCCLVITACNKQQNKDEVVLRQAAVVHNEMMEAAHELEERLDSLGNDSLNAALADSVSVWKELFEEWENDVVEVPGNEEHAGHGKEEHHHEHKSVEVTPDQMLIIQRELKNRLDHIRKRIEMIRQ